MEAKSKKLVLPVAVFLAAVAGIAGGTALIASRTSAQSDTTVTGDSVSPADTQVDESQAHHTGANGTKEELLAGDTAEKAKAAALQAVPGGTVLRVETDAEGAAYEAHMTKSDGTRVTVKMDSNFKVTSTEDDGGHRH
jgi:uncharacterized membrane protein YkoI